MTTTKGQAPANTNTASGVAITQVLAYLDGLSDDAAAHIYPSDLEKCMTSACVVEVASVRAGDGYESTVPLFSREQVVAALASAPAQPAQPVQPAAQAGEKTGHCHKRANDFCRCSRKAMLCDGVGPPPQPAAQDAEWVPVTERLPEPGIPVLLDIGAKYPIRAAWAAKATLEAFDDDSDWAEYDEETGSSWCPEGWYEWNQHEEVHWAVNAAPIAWMELPATHALRTGGKSC